MSDKSNPSDQDQRHADDHPTEREKEIGGPKEADPTRYGDWTVKGRCIDF